MSVVFSLLCMLCFAPALTGRLNPSPTRLLLLLQGPVFDKRRLNRAARPPWSRSSSFPLDTPPPPLPQTATPQRVRWRRKTLLPSVGSRWSPSPIFLCNFPLHLPSFPSSCSPGFHTLVSLPSIRFATIPPHVQLPFFIPSPSSSSSSFVRVCWEAHAHGCPQMLPVYSPSPA